MRKITIFAAMLILMGSLTGTALAVPNLQLDIVDGIYVGGADETTYSTTNPFTLQAFYAGDVASYGAILSVAVVPSIIDTPPFDFPDLGSFTYSYEGGGALTVDVTGDMSYGNPPIATISTGGGGDLAPHGVFDTYFMEIPFTFDLSQTIPAYDTQTGDPAAGTMAYRNFIINFAGLDPEFHLHFDLYHLDDEDRIGGGAFAPFSHDAQTNGVPEAASLSLLASGLVGLAVWRRRIQRMQ